MDDESKIVVEVLFVTDTQEYSESVPVDYGTTIAQVLEKSQITSIAQDYFGSKSLSVGIWGKRMKVDTIISDGDRIEIYRDLIADPKELRRSGRLVAKRV